MTINIKKILKGIAGGLSNKNLNRDSGHLKITPDETELNAYKEKERLAKVKVDLDRYRKTDHVLNGFHMKGNHFLGSKENMMKQGNSFADDPQHSLLKQGNLFSNKENIMKVRRIW